MYAYRTPWLAVLHQSGVGTASSTVSLGTPALQIKALSPNEQGYFATRKYRKAGDYGAGKTFTERDSITNTAFAARLLKAGRENVRSPLAATANRHDILDSELEKKYTDLIPQTSTIQAFAVVCV
jgi:hypothetical protein